MSFSGGSNAPWQRNNMMSFHQGSGGGGGSQQIFMQPQQQGNMNAFGHDIFQSGNSVSYPQTRTTGLNPVAFQQGGQSQHYNSIGTVTKINSDCGLVNDEVFFYRNVCKGHAPKLGDRVLFEATCSSTGQFKWNATRIQTMPQQSHQPQPLMGSGGKGSGYNAVPPPNEYLRLQQRHNSPRRGSPIRGGADRHGRSERRNRSRDRDDDEQERKRRREDHVREREKERERDRDKEREKERERDRAREREKERTERANRSPYAKTRRARTIRRYMVQIPKSILSYKNADIQELRQRYSTLYIPSDFFNANITWSQIFTPDNSFSLHRPCQFHIMHKIVESPFEQKAELLDPEDANYLYTAKVMLLACPPIAELYQKCFEDDDSNNEHHAVHPSRLISFLVGTRGRNEPMAIGGPWSPSLDGENPDTDPAVLIRTAIRTCKALTGIDLSNCTQWYRFVELHYHRNDYKHKEKDGPPRIETVVIYLPDVHSCMPSVSEWPNITQSYKTAVEDVIARKNAAAKAAVEGKALTKEASTLANSSTSEAEDANAADADNNDADNAETTTSDGVAVTPVKAAAEDAEAKADDATPTQDTATVGDNNANEKNDSEGKATHYSKLDLKTLKLQNIRNELEARNLPAKGARNMLMARLAKALNAEKEAEEEEAAAAKDANEKKTVKTAKAKTTDTKGKKVDNNSKNAKVSPVKQAEAEEEDADAEVDADAENEDTAAEAENEDAEKTEDNEEHGEQEEHEEWADVIDVDMSDIVILDEYDSSKNPEDTPKELDEKEKNQLLRRYTVPSTPHIIVHPDKKAKGGKFDCSVMSLSVLLDYRPEDTKERFFEVSLFAELFNEMLMRDFGFNIYKELYVYKENETTETKDEENNSNKKEDSTPAAAADESEKTKDTKDAESKTNSDASKEKSPHERRASKRSGEEEPEDDSQSAKSSNDRKRKSTTSVSGGSGSATKDKETVVEKKMVVVKPELLLSFVYFDTSHCGYIFEKDLEDLFSILGLNLSRGQIKKVLGKLATRQAFYYRKFTDKEENNEAPPSIEDTDEIPSDVLKMIALGNRQYYHIFDNDFAEENGVIDSDAANGNDGLINYNGAVVHVGKLIEQIKRTEKNFSDLEKLYNDIRKQHTDLQKENTKTNSKVKELQADVKNINRKLSDADQDLYSLNRKYRDQQATLFYVYNRVSPYFNREKDKEKDKDKEKEKEKDKDHKSESGRDKDADKEKEKEKDKDKDKHKEKDDKDSKDKEKNKDGVKSEEKSKKSDEKDVTKSDSKNEKDKEIKEEKDVSGKMDNGNDNRKKIKT